MQSLARTLQSRAPRALSSAPLTTNASLRTITTQNAPNWCNVRNASILSTQNLRAFSTSPSLLKKKDKKSKGGGSESASSSSEPAVGGEDPFDFSAFEDSIKRAIETLKTDVSKIRTGGRLNPEVIENFKVVVDKSKKETVRLGDLAQVIPKGGRMVTVLVGDEEFIKPVTSAIAGSKLSLNAQQDPNNSLQLNVPIPPPTKESRDAALREAKAVVEKAHDAVRSGRLTVNKKLQSMGKAKTARPDDLRKAKEMMEKITTKGKKDVDDIFAGAKKMLEQ